MKLLALWITFLGLVSAIVTISFTTRIPNDVLRWLIENTEGGQLLTEGRYSINPYAFGLTTSLVVLSAIILGTHAFRIFVPTPQQDEIKMNKQLRSQTNKKQSEIDKTRNNLKKLSDSSTVSSTRIRPIHALTAIHYKFIILDKYDGEIDAKFSIQAKEDLLFWEFWIEADDYAKKVTDYGDIALDFKLINGGQRDLTWFPVSIQNNRLVIIVAFFPILKSGETAEVQLRYRWPGFFNHLKETGSDKIYWAAQTAEPHRLVRAKIEVVATKRIKRITCVNSGNRLPEEILLSSHDGKVWTYEAHSDLGSKLINLTISFV